MSNSSQNSLVIAKVEMMAINKEQFIELVALLFFVFASILSFFIPNGILE